MGHIGSLGVSRSYWRPLQHEVLQDYCKAVDLLTLEGDKDTLRKQVEQLTEKTKDNESILMTKLQDKENSIYEMREKYDSDIALLKEAISDMQQLLKNPEKLAEISKPSIRETSR